MVSILFLPVVRPDDDLIVNPARIHVLASPTKAYGVSDTRFGGLVSPHNMMVAAGLDATPVSSVADGRCSCTRGTAPMRALARLRNSVSLGSS